MTTVREIYEAIAKEYHMPRQGGRIEPGRWSIGKDPQLTYAEDLLDNAVDVLICDAGEEALADALEEQGMTRPIAELVAQAVWKMPGYWSHDDQAKAWRGEVEAMVRRYLIERGGNEQ